MSKAEGHADFEIGGQRVSPGERLRYDLPIARLPTHTQLHLPLTVLHGLRPGPRLWVSAAVHGDELNGVEIIRQLLDSIDKPLPRGTVIAVPVVNVFGFIGQSRYLPDRRDLNRSFPGSLRGSLAGRIAHLFMTEIVARCTHGIDLHTAARDRTNLPQVRGDLAHPETLRLAEAFRAPAMIQSNLRDGSLRAAATRADIPMVMYEGGEAMRFNAEAIGAGVRGVRGVMHALGILSGKRPARGRPSLRIAESKWIRARLGGLVRLNVQGGDVVQERAVIGSIADPFGDEPRTLVAPFRGLVLGHSVNPVVHQGDGVVHLGRLDDGPEPT